ncbi:large conductance mechanosensitive channel protein MscL [Microbacterium elymi]|uniref:Large-conductance mechanosensitive channel n=1 Tax=Microbacterium elymi TaxID=2909587 RepID=A0ABY3STG4_9MICO|nr:MULTISPECIES: large conductance mechanosensitive channel protein MscL [Microbacterium]UJP13112.2 large conductance mechanosensitive channel protein MscL [Microbacterium elymi]
MIKGFREFITKGNVIDLAVAVVIGAAFAAVINAFVEAIINPLVGAFVPSGDLAKWTIDFPGIFATAHLGIGAIISALITFLATALVVYFVLVLPMNRYKERRAAKLAAGVVEEEPALPSEQELLVQIRDLLEKPRS